MKSKNERLLAEFEKMYNEIDAESKAWIKKNGVGRVENICKVCERFKNCKVVNLHPVSRANCCYKLTEDVYVSPMQPAIEIPEPALSWTERLSEYVQYRTQYDSGVPGAVNSNYNTFHHEDFDSLETALKSRLN